VTNSPPHAARSEGCWLCLPLRQCVIPAVVLCAGVALSLVLFAAVRTWGERRAQNRFDDAVTDRTSALAREAESDLLVVQALASFYAASDEVQRHEFHAFVAPFLAQRSGIRAFEWVPRVRLSERAAFEAQARKEGLEGFQIKELTEGGGAARAQDREEYFPVFFVEPYETNAPALGLDLACEPARREALLRARDTGGPVATAKVSLIQGNGREGGFLVLAPVFNREAPTATPEDRRKALEGFVLAVFTTGDYARNALDGLGAAGIDAHFFDGSSPAGRQHVFTYCSRLRDAVPPSEPESAAAVQADFRREITLDLPGRKLEVVFAAVPGLLAAPSAAEAWMALAAGLLVTSLLTVYLVSLKRHAGRTEMLAAQFTATNKSLLEQAAIREKVEQALRKSESRYRTLFEGTTDAMMMLDEKSFFDCNEATLKVFGCAAREEFVGRHPSEFSPPTQPDGRPSLDAARDRIEKAMTEGSHRFEWLHCRKDGSEFPAEVLLMRMELDGRRVLQAFVRDITDRKRMERELRRLAVIAEQAAEGIAVADLDGNLQFVNDAWARMHGYESGAELVGKPLRVFHTDEQFKTEVEPFNATVKRQGHNWAEVGHVRRDRTTFPTQMSVIVLKDEQGEPYGIAGFAEDITNRKRAEEERRRLAAILEATPDFVGFADAKDGHVLYINKAGRLMTGLAPDEDVTRLKISDVHPEWANRMLAETVLPTASRDGVWTGECAFLHRDGHEIPVLMALLAHKNSSGEVENFSTISRDITDRKRAEEAIRQAKVEAEQANAAKGDFLANMSHEIRTPITAILGFAEMIGNSIECCTTCHEHQACPTRVQNKENIQIIRRNGEHLLELINDILDISKIEAGKLVMEVQPCSLPSLIADVASTMRLRAEQRGLRLSVEYETGVPETIRTDGARVRQALVNLVGNAVKFTERGGVRIAASSLPAWRDGRPAVRIKVIDTGIGIRQEDLVQLFQPFVQADASTSRKYGGTGLGLAISRHLAELLGGELAAESAVGAGSTFTLTIPTGSLEGVLMLKDPAEAAYGEAARLQSPAADGKTLLGTRVLLAEDGPDNQRLIRTILSDAGAEVELAVGGREAVAKARAGSFDVVLMDMQMPEMDGYEATRLLRSGGCAAPILALTAHAMASDREKCLAAGCTDHLAKPIDRGKLIRAVARHAGKEIPGELPAVPAPKTAAGAPETIRSQYVDDADLAEVLAEFVKGLPGQVEAMSCALAAGRHEELRRLAHRLKGAGGSYGYPQLTEVAQELEKAAIAGDVEAAGLALGRLTALSRAVAKGATPERVAKEMTS